MRLRFFLAIIMVMFLMLNGCGSDKNVKISKKVGLVTDVGKIDDKTFNQFAYEGMIRAAKEFGLASTFIETMQPTDYEKNIYQLIDEGYGMIITVGFMLGDATYKYAKLYPEIKFAIVDYAYDPPLKNVRGLVFAEDEAGFLVGALAGMMTKTGIIGFVGGKEIPPVIRYRKGYEAGAKYVNPKVKVLGVYIDSFTDPARGKEAAESQIAEGADVIFGAGGITGSGGIKAAHDKGVFCIGVDTDEYYTTFNGGPAPYLLTSAMKRVDNAVYQAVKDYYFDKFTGGTYVGTVKNGGIGYAPFHDAEDKIPEEVKKRLKAIYEGLKLGTVKTGVKYP